MTRFSIVATFVAFIVPLVSSQPASTSPSKTGPYNYGFDPYHKIQKRATDGPIFVEGIPVPDNVEPPVRPEIRQLRNDKYGWNLYLLALSMLQYTDQDDPLSYYQLAGIHGIPFQSWNGVEPKSKQTKNTGYCTHASVLFPTWHRPYLALFEKSLYTYAQEIASWYPNETERNSYIQAAKTWRMPYWDWALDPPDDESIFIPEFTTSGIRVNGPAGTQYIANPLYSYRFNPLDTSSFHYVGFQSWRSTQRYPTSNNADAVSQNTLAAKELDAQTNSLQQRIFTLLSRNEGYHAFSSKVFNSTEGRPHESIEAIHDVIHVSTGGRGHLYYIPFSAFDPIFFLHHTNVDRLTAIWQTMYPDEWITQYPAGENSYTTEVGDMVDANTPLTPFYSDAEGNFWTSNMARDTRVFGYVYEDTLGFPLNTSSASMSRKTLVSAIVTKYGHAGVGGIINAKQRRDTGADPRRWRTKFRVQEGKTLDTAPDFSRHSLIPDPPAEAIMNGDKYYEWLVNVNVPNRALESTFAIHFFLGPPPENVHQWGSARNLVGSVSVFAMLGMGNPKNQVVGTVPLTSALLKIISMGWVLSLDEQNVLPFLQKNLHVRVAKDSTQAIEPDKVPGLVIKIAKAEVKISATGEELPSWGPVQDLFTLPPTSK
ncbi:Tyrosinase [Ceratocystis lukuohia]|uniref:tyrosinase n=2 Tax=Ceratocystis TaxID=5157 RepID=A0A0F8B351_CERFI|nr:Tyrosinase [Ceratocystis platani]